jgi:hypothetical protein
MSQQARPKHFAATVNFAGIESELLGERRCAMNVEIPARCAQLLERAEAMDQEQRYVVTECPTDPSLWAIEDLAADGDFMYRHPVMGIRTRKDAEHERWQLVIVGRARQAETKQGDTMNKTRETAGAQ